MVVGNGGYTARPVYQWLRDVGAAYLECKPDSELMISSNVRRADYPALRRSQALAAGSPVGVELARYILSEKVRGQRTVLNAITCTEEQRARLEQWIGQLDGAHSIDTLTGIEASAAADYWRGFERVPISLIPHKGREVPAHWQRFDGRGSRLTGRPQHASDPLNACLNLCYRLLALETELALQELGLDPGVPIWHSDQPGRPNLTFDVMEAARPAVDRFVLALFAEPRSAGEFAEDPVDGSVRVAPQLTWELLPTCELWRQHIAPTVEHVANTLARTAAISVPIRTPITRGLHHASWDERKPDRKRRPAPKPPLLAHYCKCGKRLTDGRARRCSSCKERRRVEQAARSRRGVGKLNEQLQELSELAYAALEAAPGGLTSTELHRHFGRNVVDGRLPDALKRLQESGRVRSERVPRPRGRPAVHRHAIRRPSHKKRASASVSS